MSFRLTTTIIGTIAAGGLGLAACASGPTTGARVEHPEHLTPAPPQQPPISASDHVNGPIVLPADERTAYERALPVFEAHCAKCHTTAGPDAKRGALSHFNMDSYPFGGHHAADIAAAIRLVLGASGKPPTMPRDNPGVVQGENLTLIMKWADCFDAAHPAQTAPTEPR